MKLKIIKFKSVQSTNNTAIKLIQKYKNASGLVVSEIQTRGKGTMGKKWISKKKNIFISIFFKVDLTKYSIKFFLIINAKIIKKVLKNYTNKIIKIKKPNDILIENKKICGILQEVIEYNNDNYLITGIGINTFVAPCNERFISTCLNKHTKKIIKNVKIIKNLKIAYEKMINDLNNNNFTYVKNKYI